MVSTKLHATDAQLGTRPVIPPPVRRFRTANVRARQTCPWNLQAPCYVPLIESILALSVLSREDAGGRGRKQNCPQLFIATVHVGVPPSLIHTCRCLSPTHTSISSWPPYFDSPLKLGMKFRTLTRRIGHGYSPQHQTSQTLNIGTCTCGDPAPCRCAIKTYNSMSCIQVLL